MVRSRDLHFILRYYTKQLNYCLIPFHLSDGEEPDGDGGVEVAARDAARRQHGQHQRHAEAERHLRRRKEKKTIKLVQQSFIVYNSPY